MERDAATPTTDPLTRAAAGAARALGRIEADRDDLAADPASADLARDAAAVARDLRSVLAAIGSDGDHAASDDPP